MSSAAEFPTDAAPAQDTKVRDTTEIAKRFREMKAREGVAGASMDVADTPENRATKQDLYRQYAERFFPGAAQRVERNYMAGVTGHPELGEHPEDVPEGGAPVDIATPEEADIRRAMAPQQEAEINAAPFAAVNPGAYRVARELGRIPDVAGAAVNRVATDYNRARMYVAAQRLREAYAQMPSAGLDAARALTGATQRALQQRIVAAKVQPMFDAAATYAMHGSPAVVPGHLNSHAERIRAEMAAAQPVTKNQDKSSNE